MTKREAKKLLPTMKIEADSENELDIPFRECQVEIKKIHDQATKFGEKVIATVSEDGNPEFNVFLNNKSITNLIEAFGDEDKRWLNKLVDLKQETDSKYNKKNIVAYPVA